MTGVSLGSCGPAVPDAVTPEGRALARAELDLPALTPPPFVFLPSVASPYGEARCQAGSDPPGTAVGSAHHITGCQWSRGRPASWPEIVPARQAACWTLGC